MYRIQILFKSGNSVTLDVEALSCTSGATVQKLSWTCKENQKILHIDLDQIEAVIQLGIVGKKARELLDD